MMCMHVWSAWAALGSGWGLPASAPLPCWGFLLSCSFLGKNEECICWEPGRCFLGLLSQKCTLIALCLYGLVKVLGHCGPGAFLKALGLGKGETEAWGHCVS